MKNLGSEIKSNLLNLSLMTRTVFQVFLISIFVLVPQLNPQMSSLGDVNPVVTNVILTIAVNIFFEAFKIHLKSIKNDVKSLQDGQIVANALLLTWFLHLVGGINGPFFVLLPLFIIESAYASRAFVENIVFGIVSLATILEFLYLGFIGVTPFSILALLLFSVRLISLILMKIYANAIGERLAGEEKITESLSGMNKKLKDIDKNKDEFIYMAAHELRTPVTAIKGYVSMILEGDAGEIPVKVRGYLADVNNINDRLIRLLNNMLNVSKIEQGKLVYQMDKENLSEITRAVFSEFIPETERKGLKYKLSIPLKIKDKVMVDSDKIQEVIGNLISNAVKYTDEGSITVRLTQTNKVRVRFEVQDTGPGISEEEQKRLFQKFHRVESNVGKTTGSGLGLYISKLYVEKFRGEIGVEAKENKGSTFWFDLPVTS